METGNPGVDHDVKGVPEAKNAIGSAARGSTQAEADHLAHEESWRHHDHGSRMHHGHYPY